MGNRKKRVTKYLLIAIVCICAVIWGFNVYRVNKLIPQVKKVMLTGNEWVNWKNGVDIRVEGMRFMEDELIRNDEMVEDYMIYPYEMKLLWTTVSLKNRGSLPADIDVLDLAAESPGWSNIPDVDFYYTLGKAEKKTSFELQPDEEIKLELPYLFVKLNFRNSEWEKLEKKDYFITLSLYPEKRMIPVPDSKL